MTSLREYPRGGLRRQSPETRYRTRRRTLRNGANPSDSVGTEGKSPAAVATHRTRCPCFAANCGQRAHRGTLASGVAGRVCGRGGAIARGHERVTLRRRIPLCRGRVGLGECRVGRHADDVLPIRRPTVHRCRDSVGLAAVGLARVRAHVCIIHTIAVPRAASLHHLAPITLRALHALIAGVLVYRGAGAGARAVPVPVPVVPVPVVPPLPLTEPPLFAPPAPPLTAPELVPPLALLGLLLPPVTPALELALESSPQPLAITNNAMIPAR